ncbi:MAG: glucoamylase family protein [Desulfosporosinus sp.]|nr:glucoamylase family protein [Desulfosporosinus sp.]
MLNIGKFIQTHTLLTGLFPVGRQRTDLTLKRFDLWVENLMNIEKILREFDQVEITLVPAGEWLLDNIYFIKEQALFVQQKWPKNNFQKLPRAKEEPQDVRIFGMCQTYLRQTDGHVEVQKTVDYFLELQTVTVLKMSELWAVPLFLRIALIENLSTVFTNLLKKQEAYRQAAGLLETWEPLLRSPRELKQALELTDRTMGELDPSFVEYIVARQKNYAEDTNLVQTWLERKAETMGVTLKNLVTLEHLRQAQNNTTVGNLITSLRTVAHLVWQDQFESLSHVEQILRQDPLGVYGAMDFASRDHMRQVVEDSARRLKVSEIQVAKTVLCLALDATGSEQKDARQQHVGYYLLNFRGLQELHHAFKSRVSWGGQLVYRSKEHPIVLYLILLSAFLATFMLGFIGWEQGFKQLKVSTLIVVCLAIGIPASEWAISVLHWLINHTLKSQPLPCLEYASGIPQEALTMVVIPTIWSSPKDVEKMCHHLEVQFLANRDPNLHFAILGDFRDAQQEATPQDQQLLNVARHLIERLNVQYLAMEGSTFYLFHRKRLWNPKEEVWMGWERKRGKLMEFNSLLRGNQNTSYNVIVGDMHTLGNVRYVLTIDADTVLPRESAKRLIGMIAHPLNAPVLNEEQNKVVEGFGLLQPRITASHESTENSRLAHLFAGEPGIDPYSFAISDPYQDFFGHGIFNGKGIYDVEVFDKVLSGRIPENAVLSHDLLEGGFLRAGLVSNVELVDDYPATYLSYLKRLQRWVRGDWQLLRWLLPFVRSPEGKWMRSNLPVITRFQMSDNLRRSLLGPALCTVLFLGLTVLPGRRAGWVGVVTLTLLLPVWMHLISLLRQRGIVKHSLLVIAQVTITTLMLPFQSVILLEGIVRTLYRLLISRKNLLEWVTAADAERGTPKSLLGFVCYFWPGYSLVTLFLLLTAMDNPSNLIVTLPLSLLWLSGPFWAYWLSQPLTKKKPIFTNQDEQEFRLLASQIWNFFEDFVGPQDNWLPPDNLQVDPPNGAAHRTSPTNIGLLIASTIAARDFGFITTTTMLVRLEKTITTVEALSKWQGHLYNWYDTLDLAPLQPLYVSAVDSGNLVAYLLTAKEGISEWLEKPLVDRSALQGMLTLLAGEKQPTPFLIEWRARLSMLAEHSEFSLFEWYQALSDAAYQTELPDKVMLKVHLALEELNSLVPSLAKTQVDLKAWETDDIAQQDWWDRGKRLMERIELLITETDFKPLYDKKASLLALGFNASTQQRETTYYDQLASEARQASFMGIALGQLPLSHWFALGRTLTKVDGTLTLLSWSGTMFEYFMPSLIMKNFHDTLLDSTYLGVIAKQIAYAKIQKLPWGISESSYSAYDFEMNYLYQAFGVPGLGFKRGLEQDQVVAPYATVLAAMFDPQAVIKNLHRLEMLGARGQYGFFEAIDFTKRRLPIGQSHTVIKSFMAHHQGMSLLALANLLLDECNIRRFHTDARVQATELILQERIPKSVLVMTPDFTPLKVSPRQEELEVLHTFTSSDMPLPEARILSNGRYVVMLTNHGGGYSKLGNLFLTRWREDSITDAWGTFIYIRDQTEDTLWSATFQPCQVTSSQEKMDYSPGKVTYSRTDGAIHTVTEVSVSPERDAEIRRITLTNSGKSTHFIELTSYLEVVLSPQNADEAHLAFNKLFVQTEFAKTPECLLAHRTSGTSEETCPWLIHALNIDGKTVGALEYETDRRRFLGRGCSTDNPHAVEEKRRLPGTVGTVIDPIFSLRRQVEVPSGEQVTLTYVMGAADSRQEALELVTYLTMEHQVERTFQLAWTRSQIELRYLDISVNLVNLFQRMISQISYFNPVRSRREQSILRNSKGQSSLWKYGISGDNPIVLVRVEDVIELEVVHTILLAHEYWRLIGLSIDLVLLNGCPGGYNQVLQETLRDLLDQSSQRDILDKPGGIFLRQANQMPEADKILLETVARISLRGGQGLYSQLRPNQEKPPAYPVEVEIKSALLTESSYPLNPDLSLVFFNGLGGFATQDKTYKIVLNGQTMLPAPWINVLANPNFGCLISEMGGGYTWAENSQENKLTPWLNDPVSDSPGEVCYLRDEESYEYWSLTPAPIREEETYVVSHGYGYTQFEHNSHGIGQKSTVFVAQSDPVKILQVELKNTTTRQRRLSLTYYAEWVLGVLRETNAPYIITEWDDSSKALLATNAYQETFRGRIAFLKVHTLGSVIEQSWTGDRTEFLGQNGRLKRPAALGRVCLSNSAGLTYNSCGAIQVKLDLLPHEERTVYILLGEAISHEDVQVLLNKFGQEDRIAAEYSGVLKFWENLLGQVQVHTPDQGMNLMLNGWLLYQTLGCRLWARTAFYQAGGAFGFRDQLQDSLALLHTRPDLTRAQILLHAAHQYPEGDVQHWWHEETKQGIRTRFSDDLLWLPYAVARYIEHTGDEQILEEEVLFLEDLPLGEEETERYSETKSAETGGILFEHCRLALNHALKFGSHGLPLMGGGDWNDSMNKVGREGKGESVWLGWFICRILQDYIEICAKRRANELADYYRKEMVDLTQALDEHGWDGQWYRRAYFDNGQPLGSILNSECRIDAIVQSWSVLSGAAPENKAHSAMQAFERELVDREHGLARLLAPPFQNTVPSPGYIQSYPPGVRENGGQYTHGVIWSILAWAKLGEGDKAWELFQMLNPVNHTRTPMEVMQYKVEPYVMAADIFTETHNIGRGGWTWYTGSAGWMYQAGLEGILGIKRRGERLYLKPCIPKEWPEYEVTYRWGETTYQIKVLNPLGKCTGGTALELDGHSVAEWNGEAFFILKDDGGIHQVMLTL